MNLNSDSVANLKIENGGDRDLLTKNIACDPSKNLYLSYKLSFHAHACMYQVRTDHHSGPPPKFNSDHHFDDLIYSSYIYIYIYC